MIGLRLIVFIARVLMCSWINAALRAVISTMRDPVTAVHKFNMLTVAAVMRELVDGGQHTAPVEEQGGDHHPACGSQKTHSY